MGFAVSRRSQTWATESAPCRRCGCSTSILARSPLTLTVLPRCSRCLARRSEGAEACATWIETPAHLNELLGDEYHVESWLDMNVPERVSAQVESDHLRLVGYFGVDDVDGVDDLFGADGLPTEVVSFPLEPLTLWLQAEDFARRGQAKAEELRTTLEVTLPSRLSDAHERLEGALSEYDADSQESRVKLAHARRELADCYPTESSSRIAVLSQAIDGLDLSAVSPVEHGLFAALQQSVASARRARGDLTGAIRAHRLAISHELASMKGADLTRMDVWSLTVMVATLSELHAAAGQQAEADEMRRWVILLVCGLVGSGAMPRWSKRDWDRLTSP